MQFYRVALIERVEWGDDIVSLRFERPAGYAFVAGQWTRVSAETPDGSETKTFTLSSAPGDPYLEITTRISGSSFKQALDAVGPGGRVALSAPGGRLALPQETRIVTFLAGGIGITPVRSMLRDVGQRGRRLEDALLVYGNRAADVAPFLDELLELREIGVRVVEVYERGAPAHEPTPQAGSPDERTVEAGFITAPLVRRHCDPRDGRPFYVTGPPPMVAAMVPVLEDLEVGDERRRIERFGTPSA